MAGQRRNIVNELSDRLRTVTGMRTVFENPKAPPPVEEFPCAALIFKPDDITHATLTGDYPRFDRKWTIQVVLYLVGSDGTDEQAEIEIEDFIEASRIAIYAPSGSYGPCTLSGLCHSLYETTISEYIKPHVGEAGIGAIIPFQLLYVEDIASLFA
jgi:hypothetical protein